MNILPAIKVIFGSFPYGVFDNCREYEDCLCQNLAEAAFLA